MVAHINYIKTYFTLLEKVFKDELIGDRRDVGICEYANVLAKSYPTLKSIALELELAKKGKFFVPESNPVGVYTKATAFYDLYKQLDKCFATMESYKKAEAFDNNTGIWHLNKELYVNDNDEKKFSNVKIMQAILQIKLQNNSLITEKNADTFYNGLENIEINTDLIDEFLNKNSSLEDREDAISMINRKIYGALSSYINNATDVNEEVIQKAIQNTFYNSHKITGKFSNNTIKKLQKLIKKCQKNYDISLNNKRKIMQMLASLNDDKSIGRFDNNMFYKDLYYNIHNDTKFIKSTDIIPITEEKIYLGDINDIVYYDKPNGNIPRKFKSKFRRLIKDWILAENVDISDKMGIIDEYIYNEEKDLQNDPKAQNIIYKGMKNMYFAAEAARKYLNIPFNEKQIGLRDILPHKKIGNNDLWLISYFKNSFDNTSLTYIDKLTSEENNFLSPNYAELLAGLPQSEDKYEMAKYSSMAVNSIYQTVLFEEEQLKKDFRNEILKQTPHEPDESLEFLIGKFKNHKLAKDINNKIGKQIIDLYILPLYSDGNTIQDFRLLEKIIPQKGFSQEQNEFIVSLAKYRAKKNIMYHHEKLQQESLPVNIGYLLNDLAGKCELKENIEAQIDSINEIYKQQQTYYSKAKSGADNKTINIVALANKRLSCRN